ncbi:MAG: glycosyltransferase family 2 protein [Chloroflexota bacterium]
MYSGKLSAGLRCVSVNRLPEMISRVFILVLCHNGLELTLACLDSLRQQQYAHAEVLIIDNASQDGTPEAIRAAHPDLGLIRTGDNLGYAGGNNIGIRVALQRGADAVFLVNNDTLLDPECVARLVSVLEADPRIGVIGPMVYTWEEGRVISSAGGAIDWWHADAINVGMGEVDRGQYQARPVDFINGCGLMITRKAIERVGLLDERYFMYWEEADWCVRIRRAGFRVHFDPGAWMRHKAAIRPDRLGPATLYYLTRNRLLFFATHTPLPLKPAALAHAFHGALRGVSHERRPGRAEHARAIQLGIVHGLQRRWGRVDALGWRDTRTDMVSGVT